MYHRLDTDLKERAMARRTSKAETEAQAEAPAFVELVHPDGERKQTPTTALADAQLRWAGWLPAEQAELEAPEKTDSGSSTLTGAENTEGTAS
jgi:hypothetical protein